MQRPPVDRTDTRDVLTRYVTARIRQLVDRGEMRQADIARRAGVDRSFISRLLKGEYLIEGSLHGFARLLETSPAELMNLADDWAGVPRRLQKTEPGRLLPPAPPAAGMTAHQAEALRIAASLELHPGAVQAMASVRLPAGSDDPQ
jgi:transcriptional regulator with XRE-family HTH domain